MELIRALNPLYVILWIALGIGAAFAYMWMITKSASMMQPDSTSSLLIKMLGGLVGRLLGMAILIFIAIKMNAFYGVLFVIVFSITHFILVLRVALKKKSQTPPKQNEEN